MYGSSIVFCVFLLFGQILSSAIPMWEFLNKDEKMSYLYSMFANQVEEFCEFSDMNNCNQELLKFGLRKLKGMPEDHLDTMDPYQRGANSIIWDSMMDGHEMMKVTTKPRKSTTVKPNSYEDDQSVGDVEYGSQSAASAKIDNVYRVPPPKGFVYVPTSPTPSSNQYTLQSGTPEYRQPPKPQYVQNDKPSTSEYAPQKAQNYQNSLLFDSIYTQNTRYNVPFTSTTPKQYVFTPPVQYLGQNIVSKSPADYSEAPLTGPMVIKVYPDGTPVREQPSALPQDDDLRQYKMSQVRLPAL